MKKIILISIVLIITLIIFVRQGESQVAEDDYLFRGQYDPINYPCPAGYNIRYISGGPNEVGDNRVATCVQNNDGNSTNDDRIVADSVCPSTHPVSIRSSEHIGLNFIQTCAKTIGAASAIILGQADTNAGVTCPSQSGALLLGTWSNEHIGLNNVTTCRYSMVAVAPPPPAGGGGSGGSGGSGDGSGGGGGDGPSSPPPSSEAPECFDSVDNDGDGKIDFPLDPDCLSALDDNEQGPGVLKEINPTK